MEIKLETGKNGHSWKFTINGRPVEVALPYQITGTGTTGPQDRLLTTLTGQNEWNGVRGWIPQHFESDFHAVYSGEFADDSPEASFMHLAVELGRVHCPGAGQSCLVTDPAAAAILARMVATGYVAEAETGLATHTARMYI